MFQPEQRLLTKRDFQSIFDGASLRVVMGELLLLANANDFGFSRLGVITPKKILRHAVQRNRVKRVCRNTFRLEQHKLLVNKDDQTKGLDIVILSRNGLNELSAQQLKEKLDNGFTKLVRVGHKYLKVS